MQLTLFKQKNIATLKMAAWPEVGPLDSSQFLPLHPPNKKQKTVISSFFVVWAGQTDIGGGGGGCGKTHTSHARSLGSIPHEIKS